MYYRYIAKTPPADPNRARHKSITGLADLQTIQDLLILMFLLQGPLETQEIIKNEPEEAGGDLPACSVELNAKLRGGRARRRRFRSPSLPHLIAEPAVPASQHPCGQTPAQRCSAQDSTRRIIALLF